MRLRLPGRHWRLIGVTIVSFLVTSLTACAVDLFEFEDGDRQYVFAAVSAAPLTASIDQQQATQRALDWARRFYGVLDLDIVDVAYKIEPTRFWLVTFNRPDKDIPLFSVVLPDGEILEPRVLTRV